MTTNCSTIQEYFPDQQMADNLIADLRITSCKGTTKFDTAQIFFCGSSSFYDFPLVSRQAKLIKDRTLASKCTNIVFLVERAEVFEKVNLQKHPHAIRIAYILPKYSESILGWDDRSACKDIDSHERQLGMACEAIIDSTLELKGNKDPKQEPALQHKLQTAIETEKKIRMSNKGELFYQNTIRTTTLEVAALKVAEMLKESQILVCIAENSHFSPTFLEKFTHKNYLHFTFQASTIHSIVHVREMMLLSYHFNNESPKAESEKKDQDSDGKQKPSRQFVIKILGQEFRLSEIYFEQGIAAKQGDSVRFRKCLQNTVWLCGLIPSKTHKILKVLSSNK